MPAPIPVELVAYRPEWAERANAESLRLQAAIGDTIVIVHHVGSTAIPGILAKPILDLIPVYKDLEMADVAQQIVERLGYAWWGEYGLPGRRYCTLDDPGTGRRTVQLHCYSSGNPEIARHLAFRDYLCRRPDVARAYAEEKARCRDLHPVDSHAYSDCKSPWIRRVEAEAMRWYEATQAGIP